jgi:hypothetical protein
MNEYPVAFSWLLPALLNACAGPLVGNLIGGNISCVVNDLPSHPGQLQRIVCIEVCVQCSSGNAVDSKYLRNMPSA